MSAPFIKRGLQCDVTWHLHKGWLPLAIYNKIGAITHEKITGTYGTFYSSGRSLAEFYDVTENHVTKILRELTKDGWLQIVGYGPGTMIEEEGICRDVKSNIYKSKNYHYVTHAEWAQKHPCKCFVREETVWDMEEHDELAQTLHKFSFGQTFWYPNMLSGLRSSGMSDVEIAKTWSRYVLNLAKKPKGRAGWKSVALKFTREMQVGKSTPQ
jgi:hypothetical protein